MAITSTYVVNFDYKCLLNKPYVNEINLRKQNLSWTFYQFSWAETMLKMGQDLSKEVW